MIEKNGGEILHIDRISERIMMVKIKAGHDIKFVLSLYTNMYIIILFLKNSSLVIFKKVFQSPDISA